MNQTSKGAEAKSQALF